MPLNWQRGSQTTIPALLEGASVPPFPPFMSLCVNLLNTGDYLTSQGGWIHRSSFKGLRGRLENRQSSGQCASTTGLHPVPWRMCLSYVWRPEGGQAAHLSVTGGVGGASRQSRFGSSPSPGAPWAVCWLGLLGYEAGRGNLSRLEEVWY